MRFVLGLLLLSFSFGITAQHKISTTPWKRLIPSDKIPERINVQKGNNNIDATKYKDRYYVAFRTAPSHFASKKTRLYIISSKDLENWEYEAEFFMESDMREPRFLVYHDTLFFYYFQAGTKLTKFEPKKCWVSHTSGDKKWAQVKDLNMDGYVPWRYRVRNDTIYLSAYYGVNLYRNNHQPDLKLFRSTDGFNYEPISEGSQIPTKGGEEGEFEFDKDGNLWATVRLEGSGAYIAYADKDSLHHWQHWFTKQKYDSALMLNHKETFYVFARRHLKGNATEVETPTKRQRRRNLIRYSLSKKKTAMYRLNKEKKQLEHIMDFPSTGDNAFPAIAQISENQYFLLNYSNDFTKKDRNWIGGQIRPTNIYWTILTIE
jgi:hypothetical protein